MKSKKNGKVVEAEISEKKANTKEKKAKKTKKRKSRKEEGKGFRKKHDQNK